MLPSLGQSDRARVIILKIARDDAHLDQHRDIHGHAAAASGRR